MGQQPDDNERELLIHQNIKVRHNYNLRIRPTEGARTNRITLTLDPITGAVTIKQNFTFNVNWTTPEEIVQEWERILPNFYSVHYELISDIRRNNEGRF